jgi:hypothetical protein
MIKARTLNPFSYTTPGSHQIGVFNEQNRLRVVLLGVPRGDVQAIVASALGMQPEKGSFVNRKMRL